MDRVRVAILVACLVIVPALGTGVSTHQPSSVVAGHGIAATRSPECGGDLVYDLFVDLELGRGHLRGFGDGCRIETEFGSCAGAFAAPVLCQGTGGRASLGADGAFSFTGPDGDCVVYVCAPTAQGDGVLGRWDGAWPPPAPTVAVAARADGVEIAWSTPTYDGPPSSSASLLRSWYGHIAYHDPRRVFLDTGTAAGETHVYEVFAHSAAGDSPSTFFTVVSEGPRPAAPTDLVLFPGPGHGEITLRWESPTRTGIGPVERFDIEHHDTTGWRLRAPVDASTQEIVVGGLHMGVHGFRVRAANAAGAGTWSLAVWGEPLNRPGPPENLVAEHARGPNSGRIALRWDAPMSDGGGALVAYRVYRDTAPSPTTLVAELPPETTRWTDSHLERGTRYFYRVAAVNGAGEGPPSNEATALG